MRKWLPWVLLTISVAFNVFIVVGMLMARAHHKRLRTHEGRAELLADELDMEKEQRATYMELVEKESSAERERGRQRRRAEYQRVWAELSKDEPDERVLERFVQAPVWSEGRKRFLEYARGLMEILRPEQRERVSEVMDRLHRRRPK